MYRFQCSGSTESPHANLPTRLCVPACPPVCASVCVCVPVCVHACGGLQLVDTADKGWFWGPSLRAYSSSIGGWCVILNNWVTSVQTLSLGVMPNICAWSAPSLRRHSLAQICSLWRTAVVETSVSLQIRSVRSPICDWTVASWGHIHVILIWSSSFVIMPVLKSAFV